MREILNFLKTDSFLIIITGIVIFLLVAFIFLIIKYAFLSKKYNRFIKKIGNSKNLEEDLENYMYRVERVEKQNSEIITFCENLNKDIEGCIQKIGMVRYSAFKDTGSDLSFALAMLDENDDGIILNGIYSREMSNIYAKPIKKGNSTYTLSGEEKQALDQAISSKKIYKIK